MIESKTHQEDREQRAIIYCRVSGKKQKTEGTGLNTQEHRCREHAATKGWQVDAVFPDDISGGGDFIKRRGMVALLAYLDAQKDNHNYVMIFDDLKRLARETEFYRKLRRILKERNASVECLNFRIEETPEGKFIETIIAAQGELELDQMGRQNRQKSIARLEQGYWVACKTIGYKYVQTKTEGKILVRDEPVASVIQEALEGFASGYFASQTEVQRFLEKHPDFPNQNHGGIRLQKITDILKHPIYAGYVHSEAWGVSLRKGRHEGLISFEMHKKIQDRIKAAAHAPARKDINLDFPLRGFVTCGDCEKPLRSCWSKSCTGKRHAYYLCQTKGCSSYGKSIRRDNVEGDFETLLKQMRPNASLFKLVRAMLYDAWDQRMKQAGDPHDVVR